MRIHFKYNLWNDHLLQDFVYHTTLLNAQQFYTVNKLMCYNLTILPKNNWMGVNSGINGLMEFDFKFIYVLVICMFHEDLIKYEGAEMQFTSISPIII